MRGMMMDFPLTIRHIVERAGRYFPAKEVRSRTPAGMVTLRYGELLGRARRLASALAQLGVRAGDRVATYAWNTHRHLELYLAAPIAGAVLHTLNIRLFPEQVAYIVNHAEDRVLFVDDTLLAHLEPLAAQLESVCAVVVMGEGPLPATALSPVHRYEDIVAAGREDVTLPQLDEGAAAGMCYTSGTTGHPKGVVYSHRALVLQSFAHAMVDVIGICEADVVMPVVPMFHANAWGLPYSATMVGATQIYPGAQPTPRDLLELIQTHRVTFTGGVPTVLLGMLSELERERFDLSSLRAIMCGGSAVPPALIERFDRLGVTVVQGWGMTETSPLATVSKPRSWMRRLPYEEQVACRARQGPAVPGIEFRVVGADGSELPWDGRAVGELEVRGPWVVADYYSDARSTDGFHDGWFRTGDVASIDADGFVQVTDRAKDVIKSGGEWISSVELENALLGHPEVLEAAVVGMPHEKWQERPIACVVPRPGARPTLASLRAYLESRVARWWLPDDLVLVDAIPKTSVGKIAKRELRERLKDHRWPESE